MSCVGHYYGLLIYLLQKEFWISSHPFLTCFLKAQKPKFWATISSHSASCDFLRWLLETSRHQRASSTSLCVHNMLNCKLGFPTTFYLR